MPIKTVLYRFSFFIIIFYFYFLSHVVFTFWGSVCAFCHAECHLRAVVPLLWVGISCLSKCKFLTIWWRVRKKKHKAVYPTKVKDELGTRERELFAVCLLSSYQASEDDQGQWMELAKASGRGGKYLLPCAELHFSHEEQMAPVWGRESGRYAPWHTLWFYMHYHGEDMRKGVAISALLCSMLIPELASLIMESQNTSWYTRCEKVTTSGSRLNNLAEQMSIYW